MQEQLATLDCLVEMSGWNPGAGHALTKAIIMVAHAVRNSLQGVPNQFTAAELLKVGLLVCCCCLASSRVVTIASATARQNLLCVDINMKGCEIGSGSMQQDYPAASSLFAVSLAAIKSMPCYRT